MMTPRFTPLAVVLCAALTLPACAKNEPDAAPAPQPAAVGEAKPQELRKVARKATLALEVRAVAAAHARAIAIAEEQNGHVLTSSRTETRGDGAEDQSATLALRLPGDRLTGALAELRRLAAGSVSERLGSEDVTEEFVDTQARLRNHRQLEEQLLLLLKTAGNVEDALKVHRELSGVRGEIERLEGRRQFLERETSWATVDLTLTALPVAAVTEGFVQASLARAKHDALAVGQGIITAGIRLIGVLLPLMLLIVVPGLGFAWVARALWLRKRASAPVSTRT